METETRQEVDDARIMAVIRSCAEVLTVAEFSHIAEGALRDILHYEVMACGIGGVSRQGNHIHKALNFKYPVEYYEALQRPDGRADSPLMQKWRANREPVIFQGGRDDADYPEDWLHLFNRHKLRNTLAHGVLDLTGTFSSFFIFSRVAGEVGPRHAELLKILVPHLHLALGRALTTVEDFAAPGKSKKRLSERQREILYWMHEGKTNWEIARILGLSEINVKYHIDQIFTKLEARNRAHAVAKGRDLGLLLTPHNSLEK